MSSSTFDVIIVGAGPVGLFLASELALGGASVVVLERDASPENLWKSGTLGIRGLNTLSVEAFYRRGLLDELFGSAEDLQLFGNSVGQKQYVGHFAGIFLDGARVDFSQTKDFFHLPGPSLRPGLTWVDKMESTLGKRAETLSVKIIRGVTITKLSDEETQPTVRVWAGEGEQEHCFEAKYLVGCDGGRSAVRHFANIEFRGTEPMFTGYRARVDIDKPELLEKGFVNKGHGMYIAVDSEHLYLIDFDTSFDRSQEVTAEHYQTVMRRVTNNNDISVTKLHVASTLTDRCRQAVSYRKGRVFLAGDSAHIHSPIGAQGLNLGIIDAMNLGWKLAAAVRGDAAETLLDTYYPERAPIAAAVLAWARAQSLTMQPNEHGAALYALVQDQIATQDGLNYFVARVWGLNNRYDVPGADDSTHALVGRTVPDFEFENGGGRMGKYLLGGKFVLVDFKKDDALAQLVQQLGPNVKYVAGGAKETFGLAALLVRPDGIVAWVAENEIDQDSVKKALASYIRVAE